MRYTIIALIITILTTSCSSDTSTDFLSMQYQYIAPDEVINPASEYLIVIGDIQEYTQTFENLDYLIYSLNWIRNQNNHYGNIKCVLQDGDVTNNNSPWQWDMAREAFHHLKDSVMYVWSTGNHDYQWGGETGTQISDRTSTLLNSYLSNPLLDKNILSYFETDRYENIILRSTLANRQINIISLEFGPRPEVLHWAAEYVRSHTDERFILMTHEYMTSEGDRMESGKTFADLQFMELPHTEPDEIWEQLVKPNDNVLCVVNGHNGFCKYLETENDAGRMVPQILFNLQYQVNGGDSMLQLWEFPQNENRVNISVYNTLSGEYKDSELTSYSFTY